MPTADPAAHSKGWCERDSNPEDAEMPFCLNFLHRQLREGNNSQLAASAPDRSNFKRCSLTSDSDAQETGAAMGPLLFSLEDHIPAHLSDMP